MTPGLTSLYMAALYTSRQSRANNLLPRPLIAVFAGKGGIDLAVYDWHDSKAHDMITFFNTGTTAWLPQAFVHLG
jgi:hypothetical protein